MNSVRFACVVAATSFAMTAFAQVPQPYAGLQNRPIKALSEQQQAELRAGRGAGMALAAELNGYPGPVHVLELADQMALSPQQRQRVQALFNAMKTEAIPKGEALIAREAELDRLFAERTVTEPSLTLAARAIGDEQADLRVTHLNYRLWSLGVLNTALVHK
jgi:hypothetical protein